MNGKEHLHEEWREGVTMAIYINLSLLAVLLVIPENSDQTRIQLVVFILASTLGLLLAHQVAFRLSSKFVNKGETHHNLSRLLLAQGAGAASAAALASVPVLIFGESGIWVSESLLLAFVCLIGFLASRSGGASIMRAIGYVAFLIVIVTALIVFKTVANH